MSVPWRLVGLGVLALLIGAALYGVYQHRYDSADKDWKAKWPDQQVLQAKGLAATTTTNRKEEQRWRTAVNEVSNDARKQVTFDG